MINQPTISDLSIKQDKRAKGLFFQKGSVNRETCKAKPIALKDISESVIEGWFKINYIGQESLLLKALTMNKNEANKTYRELAHDDRERVRKTKYSPKKNERYRIDIEDSHHTIILCRSSERVKVNRERLDKIGINYKSKKI